MALYSHTLEKIRDFIKNKFFSIQSTRADVDTIDIASMLSHLHEYSRIETTEYYRMCQHILWMLDEIEKTQDSKKAARWIGYVLDRMEILGFLTNKESREMIRIDKNAGRE